MVLEGEKEVMQVVAQAGAKYGYGNCIAWLKRKWIDSLENTGLPKDSAEKAVDVSAYPKGFNFNN